MRKYAVIIPVYNRPQELNELLQTLTKQTYKNFEVLVIEDGSSQKSEEVVRKYSGQLDLKYYYKENSGQGFSRNYGFAKASGDYFIIFDSDILLPPNYFELVEKNLNQYHWDAFGGPDRSHESFTSVQKAISYTMTSIFTTGGIRGGKKRMDVFHPRSFNMGIAAAVYQETGGFKITRMAEDLEFSLRIIEHGYKVGLISEAFVYHKRRTSFTQFFKQLHFFGRGRINLLNYYPDQLKIVHALPAVYALGLMLTITLFFIKKSIFFVFISLYFAYSTLILLDAAFQSKSLRIGIYSVWAANVQLIAYGSGFLRQLMIRMIN
ncbi:MAG: glycosyltransferase [Candidatus Cyclobacteriaceae bacterium M3_2C_046]